jgi:hypothetical protein
MSKTDITPMSTWCCDRCKAKNTIATELGRPLGWGSFTWMPNANTQHQWDLCTDCNSETNLFMRYNCKIVSPTHVFKDNT